MNTDQRPTRTPWIWPTTITSVVALVIVSGLLPGLRPWGPLIFLAIAITALVLVCTAYVAARRQERRYEARIATWAAERAVAEERLRVARDLHDLASHGLGLMTVRASSANLADDAERRLALADIEKLGREATAELRRMLSVLRSTAEDKPAPLVPALSLDDLPAIIAEARRTGLEVDYTAAALGDLSRGLQLTVVSIVREGLANVLRHAGPTSARLELRREAETIVIDLVDAGPAADWSPHPGAGHGLVGLRERVAAHGGVLTTGPVETGFRLNAVIDLEES